MSPVRFLAACVQLTSRADVTENLRTAVRLAAEARARGAELVVLPENFAFMGVHEDDKLPHAETLPDGGPILAALREIAATGLWVVGGGMPERSAEAGKVHNTAVVIAPSGDLIAKYRKIHLFDIAIPGAAEFRESRTVVAGQDVVTCELPFGTLGLSICYDLRFPELYRALTRAGARIAVVPAAFTLHTGKDHWRPLLQARAIENQLYVLAPAQVGRAHEQRICWGHSLVVDPWGTVLAEAPDRPCVVLAEIDTEAQDRVRRELPCLSHARL
jgi:deaminated glutathione amidase